MQRVVILLTLAALTVSFNAALAQPEKRVVRRMPQADLNLEAASDRAELPMRTFGGRPVVEVMIAGKGPFDFILDTGAGGTVVSSELAEELGLETTGTMRVRDPVHAEGIESAIVAVETLEFAGFTVRGLKCPTISEKRMPKGDNAPRGVMSLNSLPGLMATFDYPGERMVFEKGSLPEADGEEILDYEAPMGIPGLPIEVGGETIHVNLDTGSGKGLLLPMKHAETLKLDGELKEMGKARLVGGEMVLMGARLNGDVQIGKHVIHNPTLTFSEKMPHGNLGGGILKSYALTIDPANKRLRLISPQAVSHN